MTEKIKSRSDSQEAQISSRLSADRHLSAKQKNGVGALIKSMADAVYAEGLSLSRVFIMEIIPHCKPFLGPFLGIRSNNFPARKWLKFFRGGPMIRSNRRLDDAAGNRNARRRHVHTHPNYHGKDPDRKRIMAQR
jgi:hypothetical protein